MERVPLPAPRTADQVAFQQALDRVRPRPHCLLYALPAIGGSFVLPAIVLCGWTTQSGIVWTSIATMAISAALLVVLARQLETRDPQSRRVDDLLLSAVLTAAAASLYASIAIEDGPMSAKFLQPWPTLGIVIAAVVLGAGLLVRRARRLMRVSPATDAGQSP